MIENAIIPTAHGPVDLYEAQAIAYAARCDIGQAVSEWEARQVEAWPPAWT